MPIWAGLDLEGALLHGRGGYKQRTVDAALTVSPKIEWDDPQIPWPFNAFIFHIGRAGFERDGVAGPTYTTEGSVGGRLFSRSGFDFRYAVTPNLSDSPGAYRAREWRVSATAGWEGFLPRLDLDDAVTGPDFESRVTLAYGRSTHEERIQISTRPAQWTPLKEGTLGVTVAETFRRNSTARLHLENRAYDADVDKLLNNAELVALRNTQASSAPELLHGFVSSAWEIGLDQFVGEHVKLSADWRRAKYEGTGATGADTFRGRGTVYLGLYFSVRIFYEIFRPEGQSRSATSGAGAGLHF